MEYISTFTITYKSPDDASAYEIALQHHEAIRDAIAVEGADHPERVTLEHVKANEATGSRTVPMSQSQSKPL